MDRGGDLVHTGLLIVRVKLGNGERIAFWHDTWVGSVSLKELYPRLFQVAQVKDISVAGSGVWIENK